MEHFYVQRVTKEEYVGNMHLLYGFICSLLIYAAYLNHNEPISLACIGMVFVLITVAITKVIHFVEMDSLTMKIENKSPPSHKASESKEERKNE